MQFYSFHVILGIMRSLKHLEDKAPVSISIPKYWSTHIPLSTKQ